MSAAFCRKPLRAVGNENRSRVADRANGTPAAVQDANIVAQRLERDFHNPVEPLTIVRCGSSVRVNAAREFLEVGIVFMRRTR